MKQPIKVKIESKVVGGKKVIIDGKDLTSHISKLQFDMCHEDVTKLTVTFLNIEVDADLDNVEAIAT